MTNWGVASLFGILGVLGCASTSDPGVSAAAGSGNAAPIPAQAAISFTVSKPASSGGACPVAGQTYDVGAPQAPSLTDPGNGLADGMQSAVVSCSVKGPAPFAFSGSIRATTSTGAPTTITVTFHDGQVLADGSGTVGISTYTPQLAQSYDNDTPCALTVIQDQVKPGSLWAHFSCSAISSPPEGECQLEGIVVFENCDGA